MKKALIALILALIFAIPAFAEEDEYLEEAWVLCQPDSWVNSRRFAKRDGEVNAFIFPGTKIFLDGKEKRGYLHAVGMGTEDGEGWVSKGYIVYYEPLEDGHVYPIDTTTRVACRRFVDGPIRKWLYDDDLVTVYMRSEEWCITNEGFIKTEFIDLLSRQDIDEQTDPDTMTWEAD